LRYIVYGTKGSSNCAIECALAEARAPYDLVDVSLDINAQLTDEFARINPTRKIPALCLLSGHVITESAAILLTIADRHPRARLLPRSRTPERAQALRWMVFMASEVYPAVEIVDYPERFTGRSGHPEETRDLARERVRNRFLILEQAIAGEPWLGPAFSLADLYVANLTRWSVGKEWRAEHCPKIERLAQAIAERPVSGPIWRRHFG